MECSQRDITECLNEYSWLINSIVKSHSNRCIQYGIDSQDLKQIAMIALWGSMKKLDPHDPSFKKYASKVIRREIKKFLFQSTTQLPNTTRRRHGIEKYPETNLSLDNSDLPEIPIEGDYSNVIVLDFVKRLSKTNRLILTRLLAGYSEIEIAKSCNTSRQTIVRAVDAIRRGYTLYCSGNL